MPWILARILKLYRDPVASTRGAPGKAQPDRLAMKIISLPAFLVNSSSSPSTTTLPVQFSRQRGWREM